MKTVEELLMPRWKVIADYPNSIFKVGQIMERSGYGEFDIINHCNCSRYPHIFKPIEWWEDRAVEDMPEYVKIIEDIPFYNFKNGQIRKLDSIKNGIAVVSGCPLIKIGFIYPSSKQEYLTYINHPA